LLNLQVKLVKLGKSHDRVMSSIYTQHPTVRQSVHDLWFQQLFSPLSCLRLPVRRSQLIHVLAWHGERAPFTSSQEVPRFWNCTPCICNIIVFRLPVLRTHHQAKDDLERTHSVIHIAYNIPKNVWTQLVPHFNSSPHWRYFLSSVC
jgi:hypothetical protein